MMSRVSPRVVAAVTLLVVHAPSILAQRMTARAHGAGPSRGWIGVSLQTHEGVSVGASGAVEEVSGWEYPVVVAVEPGSPAQRAGVVAGDTVIRCGGKDARDVAEVIRSFKPGQQVAMRVRHNGVRDISITVGEPPRRVATGTFRLSIDMKGAGIPAPMAAMFPGGLVPIAAPLPATGDVPLAGAEVAPLNPDLADALHVKNEGVLVIDVVPGTPAMDAGLKGGDVIVSADTFAVTSPMSIMKAMFNKANRVGSERTVTLDVLRKGKVQKLALHW